MQSLEPVVAAVPTYDMAGELTKLLPQLLGQGYDRIIILDDASTDQTVEAVRSEFGDEVTVVEGRTNVGSGGNRNRVIPALKNLGMSPDTIINFVDADLTLLAEPKQIPETARELLAKYPTAGIIGGLIMYENMVWSAFNYGPLLPGYLASGVVQLRIDGLSRQNPEAAHKLYQRCHKLLEGWPDPTQTPRTKRVGWTVEGFSMIRARTFDGLGGYDPKLKYCETMDLSARMRDRGLERIFDPTVGAIHHETNVRGNKRATQVPAALFRLSARELIKKFKH